MSHWSAKKTYFICSKIEVTESLFANWWWLWIFRLLDFFFSSIHELKRCIKVLAYSRPFAALDVKCHPAAANGFPDLHKRGTLNKSERFGWLMIWSIQVWITKMPKRNDISYDLRGAVVAGHQSGKQFSQSFHNERDYFQLLITKVSQSSQE